MEDFDMDINKLNSFVAKHKIIIIFSSLILICAIAVGGYLINQHNKRVQFEREHPLVNKVYEYYYKEEMPNGDWKTEEGYYIFGNNEYRDRVVDINKDDGDIKYVRKILHNKDTYKKAFKEDSNRYVVKDGRELFPAPDSNNNFRMKDGKNWTGNWNPDIFKNEEKSGEVYMISPVNPD